MYVAEALQKLIRAAVVEIVHPVDGNTSCAVLQYADDTLLMLRGEPGVSRLKVFLDQFVTATRLYA
jgi:hypothetical protein